MSAWNCHGPLIMSEQLRILEYNLELWNICEFYKVENELLENMWKWLMFPVFKAVANGTLGCVSASLHYDVIKWKKFLRYWPFVRGIHRWPVNSLHKGQWRGTLMFSLICPWTKSWANNRGADDLRRHRAHYDVTVIDEICPHAITSVVLLCFCQ